MNNYFSVIYFICKKNRSLINWCCFALEFFRFGYKRWSQIELVQNLDFPSIGWKYLIFWKIENYKLFSSSCKIRILPLAKIFTRKILHNSTRVNLVQICWAKIRIRRLSLLCIDSAITTVQVFYIEWTRKLALFLDH